jgi:glycerol-3-phosphate dehydrogenase (NAD(P)+)
MMKVTVLGAGSWGTALAQHLARNNIQVNLWGRDLKQMQEILETKVNSKYLPGITLSNNICAETDLKKAIENSKALIVCLPAGSTRFVLNEVKKVFSEEELKIPVVSTAKGLEKGTNKRVSQVISEVLGDQAARFVLSGPSFASEVANGLPTAVVLARHSNKFQEEFELFTNLFHRRSMRVYSSSDLIGVELGGILKNIISIASGIGDGLKLGLNARAALLTRGVKELVRLIEAEGGNRDSGVGLSGLGDLILTATGDLSRNRTFGIYLGEGMSIEEAKEKVGQTIEAMTTAQSALELATKKGIDVPIIEQVAEILSGKTTPIKALQDLMTREQKAE